MDEDVNIVIQSSNRIEVTYSEGQTPYYITKDDFDKLLEAIKRIDPSVFSSDEKLFNDCVTVMFYKKDGKCITKTIPIEQKEAHEIWKASTHIVHKNNNNE